MVPVIQPESVHNYFMNSDWNLEDVKRFFGDSPTILTRVLFSRSCPVDVVQLLLEQGADIKCQDEAGLSPLMISLQNTNDKEVIRVLLVAGAEVNKVDGENKTPLLKYLEREDCSVEIVKMLLDFKADVNHKDEYGESPLTTAIRKTKDNDVIRVLVKRGAQVNDLRDSHNSPLLVLLKERKKISVSTVKLLLANGADPNCVDNKGDSTLVCAIRKRRAYDIIQTLLKNGANVNMVCGDGETALLLSLRAHCDNSVVELLLRYKANVNFISNDGDTPLLTALTYRGEWYIISVLLKYGADVHTLDASGRSPLCCAFSYCKIHIVMMLLEAGSSPHACEYHSNPLHCATFRPMTKLREDLLNKLLEANIDLNGVDAHGRSILCFALKHGATANVIQLLLNAGVPINACAKHSSPLICAILSFEEITEDVVRVLLDNGARLDEKDLDILKYALSGEYETGAIKLLLKLPGMGDYVASYESLLHLAVKNPYCQIETVELLISKNVKVFSITESGRTPLHCAAKNRKCDLRVIQLLLELGSPVNVKTKKGYTPLMFAVENRLKCSVLKKLLLAGAHIGKDKFFKLELLEFLARGWDQCDNLRILSKYEILAKFYLLQNQDFNIETFQHQTKHCIKKLLVFLNKCLEEVEKMNSLQLNCGHTFHMLVNRDCVCHNKNDDVDQILTYLLETPFPLYFDVISARIARSAMEAQLKKLQVRTNKIHSVEQVCLNCDMVRNISEYLSDQDLLKFIVAFYIPDNQNYCGRARKD